MKTFFSVLIVNFNGLEHLPACFSSLQKQTFQNFEVVFVDNASTDDSILWVSEHYSKAHILKSDTNLGFAGGNNLGFAHCKSPYVYLLNNDTVLFPDTLEKLKAALDRAPPHSVIQSLMLDFSNPQRVDSRGDTLYWMGSAYNGRGELASDLDSEETLLPIASACGGASLWPANLFRKLGGFDESYFLIFEDLDLSFRARHFGASIYLAKDSKVLHKGSASIGRSSALSTYHSARNLTWTHIKNYPIITLIKASPMLVFQKILNAFFAFKSAHLKTWIQSQIGLVTGIVPILKKRRKILSESKISRKEFEKWLRKKWLLERLHHHNNKKQ